MVEYKLLGRKKLYKDILIQTRDTKTEAFYEKS